MSRQVLRYEGKSGECYFKIPSNINIDDKEQVKDLYCYGGYLLIDLYYCEIEFEGINVIDKDDEGWPEREIPYRVWDQKIIESLGNDGYEPVDISAPDVKPEIKKFEKIVVDGKNYLKSTFGESTGEIYDFNIFFTEEKEIVVGKWNYITNRVDFV
jgi:hypothetical protein